MTFENEKRICKLMMDYIKDMTIDIPDKDFNKQVIPNSISPAWVLGHLCYETARTASWLDMEIEIDSKWSLYFSQGKSPLDVPDEINKDILISEFHRILDEFLLKLNDIPMEVLNRTNPSKLLGEYFPRVHNDVSHTLTSHLGIHGGHIGMWRKVYGLNNKYGRS